VELGNRRALADGVHGRSCVAASGSSLVLADAELAEGSIEVELAVGPERSFHGVVWRARDEENYESFFVRPHQKGNPDAIQYTPVFNGISSWQLYHGAGFWAPVAFPLDAWFRIRVVFAEQRAEVYVGDLERPALVCRLRAVVVPGRIGLLVGGPDVHVAEFSYDEDASFRASPPPPAPDLPGTVRAWEVSDAFPEGAWERAVFEERTWTPIESESSGLVDLARVQGIRDGRNAVLARTIIHSQRAQTQLLDFGFSDRALVFLNGRPLFRGDDTYRSRDYRFLGSIGWNDALYLPLAEGANELVFAVAEDFGGWGVQARLDVI
jgi:hypothetical protein